MKVDGISSNSEGWPITKKLGEKLSQLIVLMLCTKVSISLSSTLRRTKSPTLSLYLSEISSDTDIPFTLSFSLENHSPSKT